MWDENTAAKFTGRREDEEERSKVAVEVKHKLESTIPRSYRMILDLLRVNPEGLTIKQLISMNDLSPSYIYSIVHSLRIWGYATLSHSLVKAVEEKND